MNQNPSVDRVLPEVLDRALSLGGPLLVPAGDPGPARLASLVESLGGSASAAFAIEAVREGFLCHHGSSRILALEDDDLALLVGDLLYAIGLRELAVAGDPGSVSTLAELIRLASERSRSGSDTALRSLWLGQAVALGVGSDEIHRDAIEAIESGEDGAGDLLAGWTDEVAARDGAGEALSAAAQALQ